MKKLILTLAILSIVSCKSRNVELTKEQIKTETKIEEKTNEVKNYNSTVKTEIVEIKTDNSTIQEIEETIIPTDPTKPIIIDGKKIENGSYKKKTTSTNKVIAENKKVSKKEHKNVSEAKQNVKAEQTKSKANTKAKKTESTVNYLNYLWWLLLAIPIYIAYRYFKK